MLDVASLGWRLQLQWLKGCVMPAINVGGNNPTISALVWLECYHLIVFFSFQCTIRAAHFFQLQAGPCHLMLAGWSLSFDALVSVCRWALGHSPPKLESVSNSGGWLSSSLKDNPFHPQALRWKQVKLREGRVERSEREEWNRRLHIV